jgi:hypothetical protein
MSSGTLTRDVRLKPDAVSDRGLQPWQFFVLAGLGCATAVTFLARGQGVAAIILGSVLIFGAALVGIAALRMLRPLVMPDEDRSAAIGQGARIAMEREKLLTLRTIKELEFDRAMGKLSEADWQEMSTRLRARAARLIRQLDSASGYRDQIERDLAKRLGPASPRSGGPREPGVSAERSNSASGLCAACSTANDHDARFCKSCGSKL